MVIYNIHNLPTTMKKTMKIIVLGIIGESVAKTFAFKHNVVLFDESIIDNCMLDGIVKMTGNTHELKCNDVYILCDVKCIKLLRAYGTRPKLVILDRDVYEIGMTREMLGYMGFKIACKTSDNIIGGIDVDSEKLAVELYSTVCDNVTRAYTLENAEASSIFNNAMSTIKKSFVNEFADFCKTKKLDPELILDIATDDETRPWIGQKCTIASDDDDWPVLSTALTQLNRRPILIYNKIVARYCGEKGYDALHEMSFLVVGLGNELHSTNIKGSPVMEIVRQLYLEGAKVVIYDIFIDEYNKEPHMYHNSGLPRFNGILVFQPQLISKWEAYPYTSFYCRHE